MKGIDISWLPELIMGEDILTKWGEFEDIVYQEYTHTYLERPLQFMGFEVKYKRLPERCGRDATFYHLITWGSKTHEDRKVNYGRCQRINWPRAIIENYNDASVHVWEKEVHGDLRVHLYLEAQRYVVVLEPRTNNGVTVMYLWTAFTVVYENYHRKLMKSYNAFKIANAAFLKDGIVTPSTTW